MSSGKGGANPSSSSLKGKGKGKFDDSNPIDQLTHGVLDINLSSAQESGWEVYGKKFKNRNGSSNVKQQVQLQSGSKAWGHSDTVQKLGMRNQGGLGRGSAPTTQSFDSRKPAGRGYGKSYAPNQSLATNYHSPDMLVPPPQKNGWGWASRAASAQPYEDNLNHNENVQGSHAAEVYGVSDVDDDVSDDIDDSDDELMSDGFDSDESQKSHETRKKNKWFEKLFKNLDSLTLEQINEPERQWHCPACQGGPGAIDWYRGLLPLISHAKTKRSKRAKLHRELAEVLEEELQRRGTSAIPAGEVFGKWKGLEERVDKEIVWPPMVMIMNTKLEQNENEKWIGMGSQELLDHFSSYSVDKAKHAYGPNGHRGISLLIFEASAVGYMEAERLSKYFEDSCKDRIAWSRSNVPLYTSGTRDLYGFMAEKQDIDNFNKHCPGKSKLKYEMRSYQEMVVKQMKQMSEDNLKLQSLKDKVAKEKKNKKALEEMVGMMAKKLQKTAEEKCLVKQRTKKHHDQNKEAMDYQEQFFKETIQNFYDARNEKEDNFEKIQQCQLEKVTNAEANMSSAEQRVCRDEIAKFIQSQDMRMEEYVKRRDNLLEAHNKKMLELKQRHFEEEKALEEEFDANFDLLLENYTPK